MNSNKIRAVLFFIFLFAHYTSSFATSVYDGIWAGRYHTRPSVTYFSITVTDGKILFIDLDEVATYQNAEQGSYGASVPLLSGSSIFPPYSSVMVETARVPTNRAYQWYIYFVDEKTIQVGRPCRNCSPLPPVILTKIF